MTPCLVPVCGAPKLDLGVWAFLCLEHALQISGSEPSRSPVRKLVDLRGRCWGDGLTCHATATTVTAHGGYCAEHAPIQPKPVVHAPSEAEEREHQLAVLAVMSAFPGAQIGAEGPSLWATRSYGDSDEPPNVTRAVTYPRTVTCRAFTVPLNDPRVAKYARSFAKAAKGWSVRLRVVDGSPIPMAEVWPDSCLLRAWRGSLLVVARWENNSFVSAWVQHSRGMPMRLNCDQTRALLKAA